MSLKVSTYIYLFMTIIVFFFYKVVLPDVYGELTDTGICTDRKVTVEMKLKS